MSYTGRRSRPRRLGAAFKQGSKFTGRRWFGGWRERESQGKVEDGGLVKR